MPPLFTSCREEEFSETHIQACETLCVRIGAERGLESDRYRTQPQDVVALDRDASRVRAQKNDYPAGRRVGRPDTTGRMVFFNLDKLQVGDSVVVEDRSGNQYSRTPTRWWITCVAETW